MKNRTSDILSAIEQFEEIPDRINYLKDRYSGEDCYILAAGPSLNKYDVEYIKEKLNNKLVIALKQSIKRFYDITDFHVLNFSNYEPYIEYKNNIVIWEVFEEYHPQMILENKFPCHAMLPINGNRIPDTIEKNNRSQAGQLSFNEYTLDKTLVRWYGPGIMLQTGFHLAIHLGVKSITTLGWDIADLSSFGDDPYGDAWQDHSYDGKSKIVYAVTPTNKDEALTVIKSTKFLGEWLKSMNIDLKIISDTNPAHKSIERIKL